MSTPTRPLLPAVFAERAAAVGTEVHTTTRAGACARIEKILTGERAQRLALDAATHGCLPELMAFARGAGFDLVANADASALATVDAGVSWAAFGVAETGSVVLAARCPEDRLVSMLPRTHVVLLPQSALLSDLDAAAERFRAWTAAPVQQPYVSLVTGASRTSDIERVLTIGVHGPRVLHVIVLGDE